MPRRLECAIPPGSTPALIRPARVRGRSARRGNGVWLRGSPRRRGGLRLTLRARRVVEQDRAEDRSIDAGQVFHGIDKVVALGAVPLDGEDDEADGLRPYERVARQVNRCRDDDDDLELVVELVDEAARGVGVDERA